MKESEEAFADLTDEGISKSISICRLNAQAAPNAHVAATQLGIAGTLAHLQAALAKRTRERDDWRQNYDLAAKAADIGIAALGKATEERNRHLSELARLREKAEALTALEERLGAGPHEAK